MIVPFPSLPVDDDTPALMERTPSGLIVHAVWCLEGERHRVGGPAVIRHDRATGVCILEEWWRRGKLYRADGPAVIERDATTGTVILEEWHGQHRSSSGGVVPLRPDKQEPPPL